MTIIKIPTIYIKHKEGNTNFPTHQFFNKDVRENEAY